MLICSQTELGVLLGPGADERDEWANALSRRKLGAFLFYFYFHIIYSLLRYKKSHGALAMAKTKPKIQNKQTKENSITDHLHKGPYRSLAHIRARKS